jgi:hypothetical protein
VRCQGGGQGGDDISGDDTCGRLCQALEQEVLDAQEGVVWHTTHVDATSRGPKQPYLCGKQESIIFSAPKVDQSRIEQEALDAQ